MIIKIDDLFCEWEFNLGGAEKYSIQDIIHIITNETGIYVINKARTKGRRAENRLYDELHSD